MSATKHLRSVARYSGTPLLYLAIRLLFKFVLKVSLVICRLSSRPARRTDEHSRSTPYAQVFYSSVIVENEHFVPKDGVPWCVACNDKAMTASSDELQRRARAYAIWMIVYDQHAAYSVPITVGQECIPGARKFIASLLTPCAHASKLAHGPAHPHDLGTALEAQVAQDDSQIDPVRQEDLLELAHRVCRIRTDPEGKGQSGSKGGQLGSPQQAQGRHR